MAQEDDVITSITQPIKHSLNVKFLILLAFIIVNIVLTFALVINMFGFSVSPTFKVQPMFHYDDYGYVAGTGSMLPTIDRDSVVYYQNNFSLTINDIYIYEQPGTGDRILHRLVYVDGDECFFKGDANIYMDPKVNCSFIKQKVKAIAYD